MKNHFAGFHVDFVGFSLSLLCAIHCAALPFIISFLPLLGLEFLDDPWIEYTIIFSSFIIASYALSHGYRKHHRKKHALIILAIGFGLIALGHIWEEDWQEATLTSCGGAIIATAHLINWKQIQQSRKGYPACTYSPKRQS